MRRLAWLGYCLLVSAGFEVHGAEARPNIVMILADDLGYGDLSCYGATDLRTPQIDRLAQRGMKFSNFYANCPVCSPTRAALLTGRYPDLVGVPGVIRTHPENSWGWLNPNAVLLPKVLKAAGYQTAIIGKWHLGLEAPNTPNARGFDHFHGFLGDMMDDYSHHRRQGHNYMRLNEKEIDPKGHATELFTKWALEFLKDRDRDQPFFLYLAFNAPHTPIQPPEEWLEIVKKREPGITDRRAKLVALIEHMDHGIGHLREVLEQPGVAENTLIIFSSDNGGDLGPGANNGPLRDGKQSMYEGGLKVPCIAVWPGKIAPGTTTSFRAMTMDLFPTMQQAAGVSPSKEIDGVSFLPTLLGQSQPELRRDWFFRRREGGVQYGGKTIEAVIRGDWKLLQNSPFAPQELYNLKEDPKEQNNLIAKERKIFQELAGELRKEIQRYGSVPWQEPLKEEPENSPRNTPMTRKNRN